jgi:hypothetical protein
MNRFLPLITCVFVGMAATLVSSCARYPAPESVVPPPSAGLAYESGSAAGVQYTSSPVGLQYGYNEPPPDQYYQPLPQDQYYVPPPPNQYYGPRPRG